jgi:Calcineurin-like phosphoesterase
MGLRFDLRVANWLAHVLDERAPVPSLGEEWEEREAIAVLLRSMENRFFSSPWGSQKFRDLTSSLKERLWSERPQRLLAELRSFLGGRPWTALLIPSGSGSLTDDYLCSEEFLRELIFIRPDDPGLILQMQDPPARIFSLTDVFPSFRTALGASTDWPGVLIWTPSGESVFFAFGIDFGMARERARWIFSHLSTTIGVDLELLKMQYNREFADATAPTSRRLTIVHLSDIHLGCREANLRIPRVQSVLANLVNDIGEYGETVVPLISGDLMDNPDEDNLDRVRAFMVFLATLGTEPPIVLLGNHDVRNDGYLSENLRMAMQITERSGAVRWFDDLSVGIACFDSVRGGKLARGYIGERQFLDMGSSLDAKCRGRQECVVLAAVHHHPIPVELPDWYARPFYERVIGGFSERTDELEDSDQFISFVEERRFAAVLHGHKHIPRLDPTPGGIPVIGCGSSVGKVRTRDKGTFMSINLLTLNTATRTLSARLMAERVAGGGLGQYKAHEIVWSPQPVPTYAVRT